MGHIVPRCLFVTGLLAGSWGISATWVPHTLKQRAQQADRVALVQVQSQRVEETGGAIPLKTLTVVRVERDVRGGGPREVTIVQLGGRRGLTVMEIPGDATFRVGERAVVFLRCRLTADRCHLVALGQGKLPMHGDEVEVFDLFTQLRSRRSLDSMLKELSLDVLLAPITVSP